MELESLNKNTEYIIELLKEKGPGIILAIVTLIVGFWIISKFTRTLKRLMVRKEIDPSLIPFLNSLLSVGLKVLLVISVASMVGIATTSFIAVLGAAGLAFGLALQGSLSNFAGGVLILLFKPFKVGDVIQAQGETGTVKSIAIFNTIITTFSGTVVYLPNGIVANDKIINFNEEKTRRVDIVVGIGYGEDIDRAKQVIMEVLELHPLVLKDPVPFVGVLALADSSVNLTVRSHVETNNYWVFFFEGQELIKKALDKAGIQIPFPQRDVHLIQK